MAAGKSGSDMKESWIYKYFSEEDLQKIQEALDELERKTCGEIVLSFHERLTLWEKLYDRHELALKDFRRLGVSNTKYRTGILFYVLFSEKYFDIIADEGIYRKIPDEFWNELESELQESFRQGKFAEGILTLIRKAQKLLEKEFPQRGSSEDEIQGEIIIN
ncbi:MAG: TPM domain-containing protein [Ignavibacteria bacterium]|nr:TPM domain-containing protein [Ignavibacteria bacterium]